MQPRIRRAPPEGNGTREPAARRTASRPSSKKELASSQRPAAGIDPACGAIATVGVTRPDPTAGFRRERHRGFELEVDSLEEPADAFAQSVVRGLSDHPRWLHCRWLYDDRGSEIFERAADSPSITG